MELQGSVRLCHYAVDGEENDESIPTHSRPLRSKAAGHRSAKKSRVVEWLPCDASTIENLDQDPGQLSTDCIRGRQTSFNVSHLLLLCEKGVIAAGEHLGTCWWYKSKM